MTVLPLYSGLISKSIKEAGDHWLTYLLSSGAIHMQIGLDRDPHSFKYSAESGSSQR